MEIIIYPAGVYQANCYIVYDGDTGEGIILDPGGDAEGILDVVKSRGISIKFIVLTHGHFDHIGGVNGIKESLGIPVYMNENDNFLVSGENAVNRSMVPSSNNISVDHYIKDGDTFKVGLCEIKVIGTPGHSPGSVTIALEDSLFTGDTLFYGSVGRTDLPGGSFDDLIVSIKEKLLIFSDETKVFPGHGPSSTIGSEKKHNPFLK